MSNIAAVNLCVLATGVVNPQSWVTLTPENVKDIHLQGPFLSNLADCWRQVHAFATQLRQGGSILVSDRGNPPHSEMERCQDERLHAEHVFCFRTSRCESYCAQAPACSLKESARPVEEEEESNVSLKCAHNFQCLERKW